MTEAHEQRLTLHLLLNVPDHAPREGDPDYRLFRQVRARMEKAGLLRCAIPGCTYPGPIELHHSEIEFSLQGGVDLDAFNRAYGLHLDDAGFREWIESPNNLEPLCCVHHRGHEGVHVTPEPWWKLKRIWKADASPAAEALDGDGNPLSA